MYQVEFIDENQQNSSKRTKQEKIHHLINATSLMGSTASFLFFIRPNLVKLTSKEKSLQNARYSQTQNMHICSTFRGIYKHHTQLSAQ